MKSKEDVLRLYEKKTLDGRDITRLAYFLKPEEFKVFGLSLKEETEWHPKEFTRENIIAQLEEDVAFGFEKALDQRGISAGFMFGVVQMWNWILEEGLEDWSENNYAQYGLPLFKATAVKYGFLNPIGEDQGNEEKYASER